MLRTLKIARIIAAIALIAFIAYLAIAGFGTDENIKAVMDKPSAIDKFRELKLKVNINKDKESTLVTEAKAFALRINPPPPPPPPEPVVKETKPVADIKKPEPPKPRPEPPRAEKAANFSLVATCRYEDMPEKSLALLDVVKEGNMWVRQGETIGHLTVQEVKDGSIVLYQGDQLAKEIYVPVDKGDRTKSLLKSDADDSPIAAGTDSSPSSERGIAPNPNAGSRTVPARSSSASAITRSRQVGTTTKRTETRAQQYEASPEEERKDLQESISKLRNLISETKQEEGPGTDEQLEAFSSLLKDLEKTEEKLGDDQEKDGQHSPDATENEVSGKKASIQKHAEEDEAPPSVDDILKAIENASEKNTTERTTRRPIRRPDTPPASEE